MPQGEDTVTGETGLRLSGGQQKRLALARTLAHPRPILILDDPFSALDKTTEVEVFEHLRQMVPDTRYLSHLPSPVSVLGNRRRDLDG